MFYKKHGVKFRNVSYIQYNGLKVPLLDRYNYAKRLRELLATDTPLIYVDEASFNMWNRSKKTWAID